MTAGEDVAFAFALLRCSTQAELQESPIIRSRIEQPLANEPKGVIK